MRRPALVFASILFGALLAPAHSPAAVLYSAPKGSITTSGCISVGIWYQEYSGGSRRAKITVSKGAVRHYSRTFRATTKWRDITPLCGKLEDIGAGTYTVRFTANGSTATHRVRVRWSDH